MIVNFTDSLINKSSAEKSQWYKSTISLYDSLFEQTRIPDFLIVRDVYEFILRSYSPELLAGTGMHIRIKKNRGEMPRALWHQFSTRERHSPYRTPFFSLLMTTDLTSVKENANSKSPQEVIDWLEKERGSFQLRDAPLLAILSSDDLSPDTKITITNSETRFSLMFKTNNYSYRVKIRN